MSIIFVTDRKLIKINFIEHTPTSG